jgi:hypothetical protein
MSKLEDRALSQTYIPLRFHERQDTNISSFSFFFSLNVRYHEIPIYTNLLYFFLKETFQGKRKNKKLDKVSYYNQDIHRRAAEVGRKKRK